MGTGWCPDCRAFVPAAGGECGECRRRQAWGTILGSLKMFHHVFNMETGGGDEDLLDALGAAAFLMQDRQALIHQHRRDMRDEDRAAQRGARDSYDRGRDEGRREGRGDW